MQKRIAASVVVGLLIATCVVAKNKTEKTLPDYILHARTVAVLVDPKAGISVEDDPWANQVAQKDVETALLNWGRFFPVLSAQEADLIIVIRKGHGRLVDDTISDPRQNNRAGVINPTDNGVGMGAQRGRQPTTSAPGVPDNGSQGSAPTQMEIGSVEDTFLVYKGGVDHPLDSPAGWRYTAKDGLRPHTVPAVDEFRKALAAADKAAAAKHP
jgi:hypothetical protein